MDSDENDTRPKMRRNKPIISDYHLDTYQQCARDVNNEGFLFTEFTKRHPDVPKSNAHMAIAEQAINKDLFIIYLQGKGSKTRIFLDRGWAERNHCRPPPEALTMHSSSIRVLIRNHDKGIDRKDKTALYFEGQLVEYLRWNEVIPEVKTNDGVDSGIDVDDSDGEYQSIQSEFDPDFEFDFESNVGDGDALIPCQPTNMYDLNDQVVLKVRKEGGVTTMEVNSRDVAMNIVNQFFLL